MNHVPHQIVKYVREIKTFAKNARLDTLLIMANAFHVLWGAQNVQFRNLVNALHVFKDTINHWTQKTRAHVLYVHKIAKYAHLRQFVHHANLITNSMS